MKRLGIVLLLLLGGFWLLVGFNGPPSRYVVEEEARLVMDARLEEYHLLTRDISRGRAAKRDTRALQAKLDEAMRAASRFRRGGWELILLAPGASSPESDWMDWGEVDVSRPSDPRVLRGAWKVRMRPLTALARLNADAFR